MSGFLERAAEACRRRVAEEKRRRPESLLREEAASHSPRPPSALLPHPGRGFVIAEIKRASPSRGPLAEGVDAPSRARLYAGAGAGAVSVLREPDFFGGSFEDVRGAAKAVSLPVLYKDFVVDPYQILEARAAKASWVLLIARLLEKDLKSFIRYCEAEGLLPLVEVHEEDELATALEAGARLVGINARNLSTLEVQAEVVPRLLPLLPPSVTPVAESGLREPDEIRGLRKRGARGFLVGEALMRSKDPAALLGGLVRAAEGEP